MKRPLSLALVALVACKSAPEAAPTKPVAQAAPPAAPAPAAKPPAPPPPPAAPTVVASVEGLTEYRLDNGLRVLLFPDTSQPRITVNLVYFVGSRHEGYGESGMAHLLEHMNFKGTPRHQDIKALLRDRGMSFNASTW